jgi:hypothetical protein
MIATYTAWRATADRWSEGKAWLFWVLASLAGWGLILWAIFW